MENSEQVIEKREKKILKWFKNKYNLAVFFVFLFAILIRIYYFFLTLNQPLWWDEAEYIVLAQKWIHGNSYVLDPVRQVLFPFIISIFLRISNGELLSRVLIFLLSIASVIGVYFLGKELYDKKIGMFASFLMSVFYMNLFFTQRLLVDIPSLAFYTFSALFFYKYYKNNLNKDLYIAAALIGIGTVFKLTTAYLLFAMVIYFLFTEKLNIFKKKEVWIAAIIYLMVLAPYLIWGYYQFHGFVIAQAASAPGITNYIPSTFSMLYTYIINFPFFVFSVNQGSSSLWFVALVGIFAILIFYFYKLFIGFDILFNKGEKELKREFFVFLILLTPIILVSIMINHYEDRYAINAFPALFIIIGVLVFKIFNNLKDNRNKKSWAYIFLIIILLSFGYSQLTASDLTIKSKLNSYAEVRDAAYWVRDNSLPTDIILSESANQMMYYSERNYYRFPSSKADMDKLIEEKKPRFYMVSAFERTPEFTYSYPQEKNLTVVQAYFSDAAKTQPIIVIYELPQYIVKETKGITFSENLPSTKSPL